MINIVKSLGGALKAAQNPWSAAAAGAAGSLVSGLLSQRSADKSMRFQAEQTGTGYQRAMSDMKSAGLNPMLAAKLGPAASASGAQASFPDIGKAVSSGFQAAKMAQETERLKELTPIEAAKMSEEVFNLELTGRQIKENISKIMEQTRKLGVVIDIEKLRMPEMKAMASFWETTGSLGQWLKAVEAAKNAGISIGDLIPTRLLDLLKSKTKTKTVTHTRRGRGETYSETWSE
jgi:hypothetical protein